jgi:hypothetical protein
MDAFRRTYDRGREKLKNTKEKLKKITTHIPSAQISREASIGGSARSASSSAHPSVTADQAAGLQSISISAISVGSSQPFRRSLSEGIVGYSRSDTDIVGGGESE